MIVVRLVTGALGVAGAAYGIVRLLELGLGNLSAAAVWLVGGVVAHDVVLAPLTVVVCYLLARAGLRDPGAVGVVGAVVLATVTLAAVPVLGRFGARADNPTLLDRNYVLGWLVLATLTAVVVAVAAVVGSSRSGRGGGDGPGAGRR